MPTDARKTEKQRTIAQNNSIHLGCTQIADLLIEHGISLSVAIKNLDVRPTMHSIKDVFRSIATAKYGIESTSELTTWQVNEVWKDLSKALEESTGVPIYFPSNEQLINPEEYV